MLPLFIFLLASLPIHAQLTAEQKGQGWQMLFDGQDASQWNGGPGEAFPAAIWAVRDGALTTTGARPGANLYSTREFRDFDLRWEWRISPKGNSGLKYFCVDGRIDPDTAIELRQAGLRIFWVITVLVIGGTLLLLWPAAFRNPLAMRSALLVTGLIAGWCVVNGIFLYAKRAKALRHPPGYEYQMIDDADYHNALNTVHGTASLYDLLAPSNVQPHAVGEWNESRILVDGAHVEHWLNGRQVLGYELGSTELRAAAAGSKFQKIDGWAEKSSGRLMLQHHGTPVWFRNIRIRELSPR